MASWPKMFAFYPMNGQLRASYPHFCVRKPVVREPVETYLPASALQEVVRELERRSENAIDLAERARKEGANEASSFYRGSRVSEEAAADLLRSLLDPELSSPQPDEAACISVCHAKGRSIGGGAGDATDYAARNLSSSGQPQRRSLGCDGNPMLTAEQEESAGEEAADG